MKFQPFSNRSMDTDLRHIRVFQLQEKVKKLFFVENAVSYNFLGRFHETVGRETHNFHSINAKATYLVAHCYNLPTSTQCATIRKGKR